MYKIISCAIFKPYIEQLHFNKDNYNITYLSIHQHNQPKKLALQLQKEIDNSKDFDKIIILYGLCGGALLSLKARSVPLVIIRVHDCMSVLLGSKTAYEELTQNDKSISWSCYSLKEENFINDNTANWELLYDKETVIYLKSVLIPQTTLYISLKLSQEQSYLQTEDNIIEGNLDFLEDIVLLRSKELLYVYENQKIKQTLDNHVIEVV